MSIKTEFISILESTAKKGNDIRNQALRACQNPGLSYVGKQESIDRLQAEMKRYIDLQKEKVTKTVDTKIKSMEAYAEMIQRERDKDPAYQSLLATTLSLLPALADAPAEDLKKRLAPFDEDPLARRAIAAALRNAADGKKGYLSMPNMDVLPAYTLPDKVERLNKLKSTMFSQLENMQFKVEKWAFERDVVTEQHINRLPFYDATIEYMKACNDDCTEYYPEKFRVPAVSHMVICE